MQSLYRRIASVYDLVAPLWTVGYRASYCAFEQLLATGFPAGGRVLDLGCGTGANLAILRRLGLDYGAYLGVDQSSAMLRRARRKFDSLPRVQFRQIDLQSDPLPDGPFELVVSTWVLEHLKDPAQLVQTAMESLGDDGQMVLLFETSMDGWRRQALGPIWRYFEVELVPSEVALSFPGALMFERFGGPGPTVAVMKLGRSPAS